MALSKEHIVAYGLGGDWVLPESSCGTCAAITSEIERRLLKEMMGDFRSSLGMRTRRPKARPSELPVNLIFEDGSESQAMVARGEFPAGISLPILPPARALRGEPDDNSPVEESGFWTWYRKDRAEKLAEETGAVAFDGWSCNPSTFSQALAKIGHSFATAVLGVDSFQPLALDLALGRTDHINYLVGCEVGAPAEPTGNLHELKVRTHNELGIVLVVVRLFARLNAPTYHVVVGLRDGGRLAPVLIRAIEGEASQLEAYGTKFPPGSFEITKRGPAE